LLTVVNWTPCTIASHEIAASSGMSTVDELDPNAHPPGGVFIEGEPLNNPAEGPLFVWLFALAVVAAVDFSVVLPTQYDYIKKVGGDAWHSQRLVSG
jgi:hypothetical protein